MKKINVFAVLQTTIKRKAGRAQSLTELSRVCREIDEMRSHLATLRWEVERVYDLRQRREARTKGCER